MVIPEPWVSVGLHSAPKGGQPLCPRSGDPSLAPTTPATLLHTWLALGAQADLDETLALESGSLSLSCHL